MAKTKKQAVAATAAFGRRSEAVNARRCSRVGNLTGVDERGDEETSGSGSERARRAANREEAGRRATRECDDKGDGQIAEDTQRALDEGAAAGNAESTIATGVESDNYFTALAGELTDEETGQQPDRAEATGTKASTVEISEEPSIRSPHRAGRGGKQPTAVRRTQVIRTTKRKGSRVIGFATPEATSGTGRGPRQQVAEEGGNEGETEDIEEQSSRRSGPGADKKRRKPVGFYLSSNQWWRHLWDSWRRH
jgi:hypothetical protein